MALERLGESLDKSRFVRPVEVNKYISTPEQLLALRLAHTLDDLEHKNLYLHWSKHLSSALLEEALSFAIDANARNKGALFAWKLKQLRQSWQEQGKNPYRCLPVSKESKKKQQLGKQQSLFAD